MNARGASTLMWGALAAVLWISVGAIVSASGGPSAWDAQATSQILEKADLSRLAEVLPGWRMTQMRWPSSQEVSAARCAPRPEVVAGCMEWLRRYVREDALPDELTDKLVAMKRWGKVNSESEERGSCDVFIARWKVDDRVVQLQESPYNVTITVADERLAQKGRSDHKEFVEDTARLVLRKDLLANEEVAPIRVHEQAGQSRSDGLPIKVSRLWWLVPSVVDTQKSMTTPDGHVLYAVSGTSAEKVGCSDVQAETDGRFVVFDVVKHAKGPRDTFDPYARRFGEDHSLE